MPKPDIYGWGQIEKLSTAYCNAHHVNSSLGSSAASIPIPGCNEQITKQIDLKQKISEVVPSAGEKLQHGNLIQIGS
jgi:hypothetical protein